MAVRKSLRLAPVRNLKQQAERLEARKLADLQQQLAQARKQLQELERYLAEYFHNIARDRLQVKQASQLGMYQAFVQRLQEAIQHQHQIIVQREMAVKAQTQKWLAASQSLKAMDELITRFRHEEELAADKREQKILDDRPRRNTNFTASYAPLPGNLTVEQNLRFFGLIYDVKNLSATIAGLLKQFDLLPFRHVKVGVLSSGEQARVSLAKAMLNRPRLLLLDEPTASLDPNVASDIRDMICSFAKQEAVGVLWTSHNMYEVEKVCDRVLFLSHGKILLRGDPKTLPQAHGEQTLEDLFITLAREPLAQLVESSHAS